MKKLVRIILIFVVLIFQGSCLGDAVSAEQVSQDPCVIDERPINPNAKLDTSDDWVADLSTSTERNEKCFKGSVEKLQAGVQRALADKLGIPDPCTACEVIADALIDLESCKDLVSNVVPNLCEAGAWAIGIKGWTKALSVSLCSGSLWVGEYLNSFISGLTGWNVSNDPATFICNNKDHIQAFVAQYTANVKCMCETAIKSPECGKASQECQDWLANANKEK